MIEDEVSEAGVPHDVVEAVVKEDVAAAEVPEAHTALTCQLMAVADGKPETANEVEVVLTVVAVPPEGVYVTV